VEMVRRMLDASGLTCLIGCHFADLKKGVIDFARYVGAHQPDVVIFDISPPYKENWEFFQTLERCQAMEGRALVVTTTNKARLDEAASRESEALEIVGKPYDLTQIKRAIDAALTRIAPKGPDRNSATEERRAPAEGRCGSPRTPLPP
jgi:DNA-binding response OmpR family regulator